MLEEVKTNRAGEVIVKPNGQPYEKMKDANIRAGMLRKEGIETKPVDVEGGFGLEIIREVRPTRIPLGHRNVLRVVDKDPNYEYRVFNDDPRRPGRIQDAEQAGWEFVENKTLDDNYAGRPTSVGSFTNKPVGNGVTGVLMRKRKDWFWEDYNEKQKRITRTERGLVDQAREQDRYGKVDLSVKQTPFANNEQSD